MLCWWEGKLVQPLRKTVWRLLKKLKIELPYDPAHSTPIHPEKIKTLIRKDIYGNPLVVQWLGLRTSTTGGVGAIPGRGTKILHATRPKKKKEERGGKKEKGKDICIPLFIAALFMISKIWKQSKCPSIDEQIKKI